MNRLQWIAVAILAAVTISVAWHGLTVPISYDEGYNLQVPENLAVNQAYGTNGSLYAQEGIRKYDVLVSTGPTLLLPVGGVFALLDEGLVTARVVGLIGFGGLIVGAACVASRLGGQTAAIGSVAAILGLNVQVDWPAAMTYGPADVLGEHTAAALLLAAGYLLARHPVRAGAALGLALLSKFLVLLAVPVFVASLLLIRSARSIPGFGLGMLAPVASWNLWRWIDLGHVAFLERLADFLRFFGSAGSGLGTQASDAGLISRLPKLLSLWHIPAVPILVILVAGIMLLNRLRNSHDGATAEPLGPNGCIDSTRAMCWAVGGSAAAISLWWLFMAEDAYGRHLLIAALTATPLLAGWLTSSLTFYRDVHRGRHACRWSQLSAVALCALLAISTIFHLRSVADPPGPDLAAQRRAAEALKRTGAVGFTFHGGWWQAPEVAFLSGVNAVGPDLESLPLVATPLQRALDPMSYREARARCVRSIYDADGYLICLPPAQ